MNTEAQRARNARKRRKLRLKKAALRAANPSLRGKPPAAKGEKHVTATYYGYLIKFPIGIRLSKSQQEFWKNDDYFSTGDRFYVVAPVRYRGMDAGLTLDSWPMGRQGYKDDGSPGADIYVPATGQTISVRVKIYNPSMGV